MSLHFDLVINCDLKEDVPEDAIEAIKISFTARLPLIEGAAVDL